MVLVGYGRIWWDLVGSGGIWWWDHLFDSIRSRKLVGSVVESFDSTNFPKFPRVAVWWWKSVKSTKFCCRAACFYIRLTTRRNSAVSTENPCEVRICGAVVTRG
jgi:hypothetical protein